MNIDSHQNIFPFLLDLFRRLDNKDFNYSNKSIISYDFKGFFFNYEHNFNYIELKNFLMRNNFAKELMNENHLFMAELLKVICQNIYYFDEYEDI